MQPSAIWKTAGSYRTVLHKKMRAQLDIHPQREQTMRLGCQMIQHFSDVPKTSVNKKCFRLMCIRPVLKVLDRLE